MPNAMIHDARIGPAPTVPAFGSVEADEQELIDQAKDGSAAAFGQLVERYERRVFRLAQNVTRNREDAEDVIQNAFIQAFKNLSTFRGDSRFYTWLVRITVNEALMKVRRRHVTEVSIDDSSDADGPRVPRQLHDWGPNPEQRYSEEELRLLLARSISKLAPLYRMVFQLRDVEGLSTEETVQALALSPSAVKTRLRRARITLRNSLNKYFRSVLERRTAAGASRDGKRSRRPSQAAGAAN